MISPKETPPEKRRRLLKQSKKNLIHLVFSRTGIVAILLLLQIGLLGFHRQANGMSINK